MCDIGSINYNIIFPETNSKHSWQVYEWKSIVLGNIRLNFKHLRASSPPPIRPKLHISLKTKKILFLFCSVLILFCSVLFCSYSVFMHSVLFLCTPRDARREIIQSFGSFQNAFLKRALFAWKAHQCRVMGILLTKRTISATISHRSYALFIIQPPLES